MDTRGVPAAVSYELIDLSSCLARRQWRSEAPQPGEHAVVWQMVCHVTVLLVLFIFGAFEISGGPWTGVLIFRAYVLASMGGVGRAVRHDFIEGKLTQNTGFVPCRADREHLKPKPAVLF